MFVEEGEHGFVGFFRVVFLEAVAGAGEGEEFSFDHAGFQAIDEPGGLLVVDVLVFGAVDAKRWGGVGGDPVEWAADDVLAALGLEIATEEEGEDFGGVDAFAVGFGEVAGAVVIHDAIDSAGLIEVAFAFELLDAGGDAEELGEVATGGSTGDTDAVRVDVIFGGACAQPADGGFTVMDCGGEGIFGRKTVGDGDGDISVLGEVKAELVVSFAGAGAEAAAVDADDGGEGAGGVLGLGEVELEMLVIGVGVFDGASEGDVVGDGEVGGVGAERDEDKCA